MRAKRGQTADLNGEGWDPAVPGAELVPCRGKNRCRTGHLVAAVPAPDLPSIQPHSCPQIRSITGDGFHTAWVSRDRSTARIWSQTATDPFPADDTATTIGGR